VNELMVSIECFTQLGALLFIIVMIVAKLGYMHTHALCMNTFNATYEISRSGTSATSVQSLKRILPRLIH
jgi:hypothetical protein